MIRVTVTYGDQFGKGPYRQQSYNCDVFSQAVARRATEIAKPSVAMVEVWVLADTWTKQDKIKWRDVPHE